MAHSSLATVSVPATNYSEGRERKIKFITVHYMAGDLTPERCGEVLNNRGVSAHYGIGSDGRIATYVEEENTAWANGNWDSNNESVTIETANLNNVDGKVSDEAYNSLVKLVADIAKRNNLGELKHDKNLNYHSEIVPTSCPGNYLRAKIDDIAAKANAINNGGTTSANTAIAEKSNEEIATEVIAGQWGNGEERKQKLTNAGYDYNAVQNVVNEKLGYGAVPTAPKVATAGIQVGDRVALTNYVDYNGTGLVKTRDFYYVSELKGDRAVLVADNQNGPVYAAVSTKNLREF